MDETRALRSRADVRMAKRDYRGAEKLYRELVRLRPDDPHLHVRHAELLRRLGEIHLAAKSYSRASTLFATEGLLPRANAARKLAQSLDPSVEIRDPTPRRTLRPGAPFVRAEAVEIDIQPEPESMPAVRAVPVVEFDLMDEESFDAVYVGSADAR